MGPLVWAAISEENARRAGRCTALHLFHEPRALRNCGRFATYLDKKLTKARRATKKNAKPVEPWSKKNIWGAGGNEVLAIDLFCRCVCGKFALCDCFCKDTGRPIKFGGGDRLYRTTAELFHTIRHACYICGTFFSAVARTGLCRR
jgi:hypothetical protein